jgi:multiple sugar transport system substrate-binding protein
MDMRFSRRRRMAVSSVILVGIAGAMGASAGAEPPDDSNELLGPMPTDEVELVVWGPGYADTDADGNDTFSKIIDDRFEEMYPNVTVTHEGFDYASLETRITTAMAAREGPDVFSLYFNPQWYQAMIPLNGYVDDELRERIQYLSLSEAMDAGSLYFMPYQSYAYVWYYNKAMFAEAGLDPEAPPATWDELLFTCTALQDAGITPIAAGWQDGFLASWYGDYGFVSQLVTDEDIANFWDPSVPPEDKVGWTDPLIRTGFGYLDELNQRGCFNESAPGLVYADMFSEFAGERAAMIYTVAGNPPFGDTADAIGVENLGVFKMPTLPDSPYTTQPMDAGPNLTLGIMEFTDHCRVAWEYVRFHYAEESQALLTGEGGAYPNVNGLPPIESDIPAEAQVSEWLDNPDNHGGFSPGVGGPTDPINRRMTEWLSGGSTLDETLEALEEERLLRATQSNEVEFEESPACD